jgi:hypothetical protein
MSIPDPSHVSFPGPFMHHDVVVAGWRVPLLEAYMGTDERVTLLLDHRIGLDLTPQEAERVIPFLADAIAIALGYPSHPHGDVQYDRAPHPRPVRTMDIARIEPGDGEAAA